MVLELGICLAMQGTWVQSLVGNHNTLEQLSLGTATELELKLKLLHLN